LSAEFFVTFANSIRVAINQYHDVISIWSFYVNQFPRREAGIAEQTFYRARSAFNLPYSREAESARKGR